MFSNSEDELGSVMTYHTPRREQEDGSHQKFWISAWVFVSAVQMSHQRNYFPQVF
jgi:hypothetical protein